MARLASMVNEATQRLLSVASDTGWVGSYHRVIFQVDRNNPYITLPPEYSRIIALSACRPMPIRNEWYEFLEFGTGLLPNPNQNGAGCDNDICGAGQAFDRNQVPTVTDLTSTNQYLRVYLTDPRDVGFRVLISNALDQNGVGIYTTDINDPVNGFLMTLTQPFTTSPSIVTSFTAVGKSVTSGDVLLKQVDATTGVEVLLSRYKPTETNPAYRRYYVRQLPNNCCSATTPGYLLLSAMCKVQYAPVANPTDYLLIPNIPALKAECESIRYAEVDNPNSQQMSVLKHLEAVRLLNQELASFTGIGFSATLNPAFRHNLQRAQVGQLT